jgi:hypothetical protein
MKLPERDRGRRAADPSHAQRSRAAEKVVKEEKMKSIQLKFDGAEMDRVLEEIGALELHANFHDLRGLLRLLDRFFDSPLEFFAIEGEAAAGTKDLVCTLKRTQRLTDLLVALRAFNINRAA